MKEDPSSDLLIRVYLKIFCGLHGRVLAHATHKKIQDQQPGLKNFLARHIPHAQATGHQPS